MLLLRLPHHRFCVVVVVVAVVIVVVLVVVVVVVVSLACGPSFILVHDLPRDVAGIVIFVLLLGTLQLTKQMT